MKSLPKKHCCNWIAGKCVGAFFQRKPNGTFAHWMEKDFVNQPCKIDQNKECNFFSRIVVPGIPDDTVK